MCGFFGAYSPSLLSSSFSFAETLRNAALFINHRGPDDTGTWVDEQAGLGMIHTRLSIIDLSPAGHQPMNSHCGRYVIAFNGEIYNHLDLREQLEREGFTSAWRGHSDTETLLACFSAWSIEKTLNAVVGMFAISLWDRKEQVLTLARDRMGEKPLYWGWQEGALLFGSELKAFKAHPCFNAEIDRNVVSLFVRYNYIPAPYCIYKGIRKLPAGHYISIAVSQATSSMNTTPYWSMNRAVESGLSMPFSGDDNEAIVTLESQLGKSVESQMLADVPLGAFLSGGVDSSTVVALMQQQSKVPVRTFSIGFNEVGYNEAEHAKAVAQHLGTEHTEFYVGAKESLEVIPKLPELYCEPFADSSQIPTYLVSKMARQHVTVALSGDGGDELFTGYNPYQFVPNIWGRMSRYPSPIRAFAARVLAGFPLPEKATTFLELLPAKNREEFYHLLISHWKYPERLVIGAEEPETLLSSPNTWPKVDNFIQWMMSMDAQQYMSDDILVKVDRAAMANSLETRVPMLDHRVVELACQLPLNMKIRDGKGKWVLREVLYRHVPRELIERPKKGFSIPLGTWLRGPLRDWAETLLAEDRLKHEGYFYPASVRQAWSDHLRGRKDNSRKLWSILMFQAWLEEHHT